MIVRGDQAIPPRGSTRIEAGDRLHVLVRQEAARRVRRAARALARRARSGRRRAAGRRCARPRRSSRSRPWHDEDGDRAARDGRQVEVVDQLRTRRDVPGALVALADGRYAFTGPVIAAGSAGQLQDCARRRLRLANDRRRAGLVARGDRSAGDALKASRPPGMMDGCRSSEELRQG